MKFKLGAVFGIVAALILAALTVAAPAQAARERWVMNGVPNEAPNHRYDTVVVNARRSFGVHLYAHCENSVGTNSVAPNAFAWSARHKGHNFASFTGNVNGSATFRAILPRGHWRLHVRSSCNWTMTLPGFLDDIWYVGWDGM